MKTRYLKRNKYLNKNKTRKMKKYYGGQESNEKVEQETKGIFDIIGDKVGDMASNSTDYIKEKSLKLVGLQPIKKEDENMPSVRNESPNVTNNTSGLSDIAENSVDAVTSGVDTVTTGLSNVSANVLENVNETLADPEVKETLGEAAENIAETGSEILGDVNEKLSSPELKQETKEALENISDYTTIALEAMDKPVDKLIDQVSESGEKIASKAGVGAIKVATDMAGAIPFVGGIIDLGKAVNDSTAAGYDIFKASMSGFKSVKNFATETAENYVKLSEQKKEGGKILNRTNQSINEFHNPILVNQEQSGGKRKTRRLLKKRKKNTKRVRFID